MVGISGRGTSGTKPFVPYLFKPMRSFSEQSIRWSNQ